MHVIALHRRRRRQTPNNTSAGETKGLATHASTSGSMRSSLDKQALAMTMRICAVGAVGGRKYFCFCFQQALSNRTVLIKLVLSFSVTARWLLVGLGGRMCVAC